MTTAGPKSVYTVCVDINNTFGYGPEEDRVYYNTINCGNVPDNGYYDEVPEACPGIIGAGLDACRVKGPCWDTDTLYDVPPIFATRVMFVNVKILHSLAPLER